jgi:type IV pilus assembly protein PilM
MHQLILERAAEKNIPHPIGEVVWDGLVLADTGSDRNLLLAAGKAEAMAGFCTAVATAGFMPLWAEPGCVALRRAYCYNYQDAADDALVVDIGARSTYLLFAGAKRRFQMRTLAFGGNAVTQALAGQLKLDFTDAEALKRQMLVGTGATPADVSVRKAVDRAREQFAQRLELELMRSLLGQARHPEAVQPVRIYLTGGGAQMPGLAEHLAAKLQLSVQAYDALRHVQLNARAAADGAAQARQHLPILVGLAASHLPDLPRPLNLVPANLRAHQRFRRRQPWWVATAALLVIAWVPPLWHYRTQARATGLEMARVEAELVPLRRLESRTAERSTRLKQMQEEIGMLRRLLASKSSWTSLLANLQHHLAVAEDAWLERLQVAGASPVRPQTDGSRAAPLRLEVSGRLLNRHAPLEKSESIHGKG